MFRGPVLLNQMLNQVSLNFGKLNEKKKLKTEIENEIEKNNITTTLNSQVTFVFNLWSNYDSYPFNSQGGVR